MSGIQTINDSEKRVSTSRALYARVEAYITCGHTRTRQPMRRPISQNNEPERPKKCPLSQQIEGYKRGHLGSTHDQIH